jgi:hypothetical protein
VAVGIITEVFGIGLPAQLISGSLLWVGLSLVLRKMFGNWGKADAVADPNQYDRGES